MDTFDILKNGLANIPGIDNDWDRFLYPNFKGSFEDDQKRFLGIPSDERIVYVRIISADKTVPCSLAITNKGIYYRTINKFFFITTHDDKWSVNFEDIDEVKYSEREDSFLFSNGASMNRHALVKKLETNYRFEFAKVLTEAVQSVMGSFDYFKRGTALMDEDKIEDALIEFKTAIDVGSKKADFLDSDERAYLYFYTGRCFSLLDKHEEAQSNLIIAKDIVSKSKDNELKDDLMPAILSNLAHTTNSRLESHKLLSESIELAKDSDIRKALIEDLAELHKSENFHNEFAIQTNLSARKVILTIKNHQIPISSPSIICLERATMQDIGISFPMGHPVEGHVYMAHPTRPLYYVPADNYEENIFLEKVNEYCYLLQALGAKEIKIQSLKGKSLDEMRESKINAEASFGNRTFNTEGSLKYNEKKHSTADLSFSFNSQQFFSPTKAPYVPKDINWLAIEPKWRRLIDNRLNNTLTEYVEEISTSENKMLSTAEELSINVELKTLATKLKGTLNIEESITSSSKETTTWGIFVKF